MVACVQSVFGKTSLALVLFFFQCKFSIHLLVVLVCMLPRVNSEPKTCVCVICFMMMNC